MRCDEVRRVLPEYSVGALGPLRAWRVRRHLKGCPSCGGELEALQRTARLIESIPLEDPPRELWESIRSRIDVGGAAEPTWPRWFVKLAPLVGALTAAAASIAIYLLALRPEEPGKALELEFRQHLLASWESPFSDPASLAVYLEEGAE